MSSAELRDLPPTRPEPEAPARDRAGAPATRSATAWRRKWWVVLFAVVVAAVVFAVTSQLSPKYQASATVQVALLGGNATSEGVTAANDLASQYAQIIDSDPVVNAVAKRLGQPAGEIRDNVSGATVNDQNLISVSAKSGDAADASQRATAAAKALVTYVTRTVAAQSQSINDEAVAQLKPLDTQIRRLREKVADASKAESRTQEYIANQQSLATLEAQRAATIGDIARSGAAGRPSLQVLNPAGAGEKVSPKPVLYAAAAFLIALLVGAQLASMVSTRRAD